MAVTRELLRYAMEVETRDAERGFDKVATSAEKSTKQIEDELKGIETEAADAGEKAGMSFGKKMAAGFAALGVGKLFLEAMDLGSDRELQDRIFEGQFRLDPSEVRQYGKTAGNLYSEGWGDGLDEVQTVVARVARTLGVTTQRELTDISTQVLAVSRTWGIGIDEAIRSTSQLMQNGLAPTAEAALDLIVRGLQEGGNEAGDMLETIDEYSQHWAAAGLSGEDAMNQIISGLQRGQRDTDKVADAVKEMRIRIVEDADPVREALEAIGLDADRIRDAFLEGGPAARGAFLEVVSALKEGQEAGDSTADAVAIIGTQFEDLGPTALDALSTVEGALTDVDGAAEELAETVESPEWEQMKRRFSEYAGELAEGFATATNAGIEFLELGKDEAAFQALLEEAAAAARQDFTPSVEGAMQAAAKAAIEAADKVYEVGSGLHGAYRRAEEDVPVVVERLGDIETAAEDAAWRVGDVEDQLRGLRDQISDRTAYLNLRQTFDDLVTDAQEWAKAVEEGTMTTEEMARRQELAVLSLRDEVARYAADLAFLPAERFTEIDALIDEGSYAEAERRLAWLERLRTIRLSISSADVAALNAGMAGNPGGLRHSGGRITAGQIIQPLTGEAFVADGPGTVLSRNAVRDRAAAGGSGSVSVTAPISVTVERLDDLAALEEMLSLVGPRLAEIVNDANEEWYAGGGVPATGGGVV